MNIEVQSGAECHVVRLLMALLYDG